MVIAIHIKNSHWKIFQIQSQYQQWRLLSIQYFCTYLQTKQSGYAAQSRYVEGLRIFKTQDASYIVVIVRKMIVERRINKQKSILRQKILFHSDNK